MTAAETAGRWRLVSITIRDFRGVHGEQIFRFDGLPGILRGNNGVGKSTVAQAIQWTLYGKFPGGVLTNTSHDKFLNAVGAKKKKAYSCELVFQRGDQRLVLDRAAATKHLFLRLDQETLEGLEAEDRLDELLGLDRDTFTRAVLLQQTRIRGLLLDNPKERNRAMDRLLGMDRAEGILELVKSRPFSKAAEAWRERIEEDQQSHDVQEELLSGQREEAERRAREYKFQNRDFNPSGLKKAYERLSDELVAVAKTYEVDLEALPTFSSESMVDQISEAFVDALGTIRKQSRQGQRLAPVEKALGRIGMLRDQWESGLQLGAEAQGALDELTREHGAHEEISRKLSELNAELTGLKEKLKAAGALRQLLADAADVVKGASEHRCPVCEQELPDGLDLTAALEKRAEALWSDAVSEIEASIAATEEKLENLRGVEEKVEAREARLEAARQDQEKLHGEIVEDLGGAGIADNKIPTRLDEEHQRLAREREELAAGVETMEQDLGTLDSGNRAIREGLLPVLRKRREMVEHEDAWKEIQRTHEKAEGAARRMKQTAADLDRIRLALLAAKDEMARECLSQAGPSAQKLYKELIRHPLFDTLEISTKPSKTKVDYNFMVSAGGSSKTAREARLVLSDGQLTAAAIGLFFALAESTSHGLDLLYVDDPTQNLDLPCKEAMAKVVARMADRRQVIVSTQDEDFVNNLESEGFNDLAVDHHLRKWDGKPSVKTTFPSDHRA